MALLVAAGAAARWPRGRPPTCWFTSDRVEACHAHSLSISVATARRYGDPAVVVAAVAAVAEGRVVFTWRDVWQAQSILIQLVTRTGIFTSLLLDHSYNHLLSEDPALVAQVFRGLAEEAREA